MEKVEWRQRLNVTPNKKVIYLDSSFSINRTATRMTARKTVTLSFFVEAACTDQFTLLGGRNNLQSIYNNVFAQMSKII